MRGRLMLLLSTLATFAIAGGRIHTGGLVRLVALGGDSKMRSRMTLLLFTLAALAASGGFGFHTGG